MPERYGGVDLPEMIIADKRKEAKDRKMQSHFSSLLIESMQQALENQEQIILFQNRRGYAPSINCTTCGWNQQCVNCDVTLTYHKHSQNMRCHYCGYQAAVPQECPACGNLSLHLFGFGTEKIEDELRIYLPEARISRMDFDTVRGKQAYAKLINDFEERRVDILVGTQMVTKGLDFDNVGVVGILSADHLLQFPDFRSGERAFQLMTQVAGRAGRKNKRGKVIIQAFNPDHPVIQEALAADFQRFYRREIMERQSFHYPPFNRLITVTLKHKKPDVLNRAMQYYHHLVSQSWKSYIIGPSLPPIPRIRTYYLLQIMIKLPVQAKLLGPVKQELLRAALKTKGEEGCSSLRVSIDVDPY
jgi:primosomal protein N' (replication factor Y)